MEDTKKIKTIFSIDATSIISDTKDDTVGEASTGYSYVFDTSLPEFAFAIAGLLKTLDTDEDVKQMTETNTTVGAAFIELVTLYYNRKEE
jgi:hypothetical protein